MKALKIIGIAVGSLIAIFLILALIAPKSYVAERSIIIDAPDEVVFKNVKFWKHFHKWSPWAEMDPQMVITFEGTDGEVGSVYKWKGQPELTGEGKMTKTEVVENKLIRYDLHFITPFESHSDGYTKLAEKGGKIEVTWGFTGDFPFPMNIMLLFMDMQEMMKKDFDRGLELLKKVSEEDYENLKGEENNNSEENEVMAT